MRRRSRVGPRKGSQENCSETCCLPKRVRQSLNTQPGASGTQDVCIKCGLTFAVKPSPGYKSEKKRDLDIGVGFLFVDRPLPLAIDASEGDGGRSTLRGADQILQGQLHQTALSCACRDARWSPISGHNYRPAPRNKLEWGRNHQTPREPEGAHGSPRGPFWPPRFFSFPQGSSR